jgi:hypothetical protein
MTQRFSTKNHPASGNILLIILIAIGLFAALMFAISRNDRYDANGTEHAALDAQQITSYADKINAAVQTDMMQNGSLVSQVNLQNTTVGGYNNGSANKCMVFDPEGGVLTYQAPPAEAVDTAAASAASSTLGGKYAFEGNVIVTNAGTTAADLIIVMPFVTEKVCEQINQITSNTTAIPTVSADAFDGTKFIGSFANTFTLTTSTTTGSSGCFQSSGSKPGAGYHFYEVLVAQ